MPAGLFICVQALLVVPCSTNVAFVPFVQTRVQAETDGSRNRAFNANNRARLMVTGEGGVGGEKHKKKVCEPCLTAVHHSLFKAAGNRA